MNHITKFFIIALLFFTGCTTIPSLKERKNTLETIAQRDNLPISYINTTNFTLPYIISSSCQKKTMRIYIEGDGLSWISRTRISDDPTPINPITAKLMSVDKAKCKAYLARPCQYIQDKNCTQAYWSNRRFSLEIIQSYNQALDWLKTSNNIDSFVLIGYSGGGAIATLLAATRNDVKKLVTIAGNLDTQLWTDIHNIEPLKDSLNPADFTKNLQNTQQLHLVGKNDLVMPKEVFQSYYSRFYTPENISYYECQECTHTQGWELLWEKISYELGN
ncbi:MAG: hypothetical protein QG567_1994 [Campylobacterota bacterium]|nr:hypothetical protein [Campylobacterota bacterium]